jgi:hypothetical protein
MVTIVEMWQLMYSTYSMTLFTLISAVLYRYTKFGDKGTEGWSWIISGSMIFLLLSTIATMNLGLLGLDNVLIYSWANLLLTIVSTIFVLIGVLKVIVDLFK